ncbi:lysosomal-trafficking regulator isoform X1 [Pundamilia nyererei]|uniref:Lysosomal-trafficking regulator isoform X1 n=2 Tax=Pundamilia nyererei TaxID=303518 RepID=A0A9Y3VSF6_9CICH|nr:PREDICTED: lysosomal-trafficking regulator isoform X1 [Pundamilia nyererei]XP_005742490.1 PREDICTED: lysosomal-trafficking regulator isoform X1 [Pundamilia nyererei]XP_005742491.1 PREDICTED: lysosomal-trafficking regulator isoform X1 [Pundamilia nyererei]XP_005742492.1 PREDICTED: lysosomal-trafficking regulator isoform X1 [Pundamilia nyererei]
MASPQETDLCYAWEKYMDCRLQGADLQVSLQSLENFLCLFHYVQHHCKHSSKDALKFCSDMSGASNTLAREFLTDVHQLCSAVAQRSEAREEDEEESHMVALGEYLVRGRGFLLLSTLDSIIDQELTCREELLTLLLSLLPLVWKIPVQEEKAPDFTLPSLLEVFLNREVKAIPLRTGLKAATDEQTSGKRSRVASSTWKSRRSRRTAQRYSVKDARKSQVSTSDSEANSEDKTGPGSARSRRSHGSTIQVSCQHHRSDASQFTSTGTTTETMSAPYPHPRAPGSQMADSETLTDPAAISIFNRMENSPFDLCHVLLSLLEKVCKFDMSINHNPGLAVSVVPTLTEILTEFGDCCGPGGGGGAGPEELAGGWTDEPIALVQRMLLRTILHLMSVDVSQNDSLPDSLRRSLTDLLRATLKIRSCLDRQSNPFAPRPKKTLQEVQDDFSFSRYRHRALLLPELLEGVLQVLLGCLQASTPNPFFFSQALELIHEFVQHRGLELFETTVLRLEGLGRARDSKVGGEASERLRGLIAGVFKIVSAVKKAKSEQLHQSVCARRRHRRCEYSHFLHHHRDLSGLPVSAFKQAARRNPFEEDGEGGGEMEGEAVRYPERCCCLAACAHQCLRLLQRLSPSGPGVLQVLAGVQAVGICCCMDPRSVVGPLLHAFKAPGLRSYQSHVLSVLGRLILDQLGGGQPSEKAKLASCNICTLDSSQLPGLEETLQHGEPSAISTSLCYRSQGILPSGGGTEDMLWKWNALEAYQELVFGEDWQLSQQIAGHVCHLTQRGNAIVQWQLYTHIFNPVLQRGVELAHHAQQLGVSTVCTQVCSYHTQCLPVEVLLVYLQTLPSLLKSRVIRDLFISCNGLNQVTELVYLDQTRSLALKVFETLIIGSGKQQAEGVLQELESADAEEREAVLGLAEELGSRGIGEGAQSLSKFYEGLKEAYPRHKSRSGQARGPGRSRTEIHLHVINLFLCVAFLCVSKEADSDRDSANDSEDTSGYDSTASEPLGGRLPYLSPDSVALPSKEQLRRAADVWSVCRWIYLASPLFQRQFFRLGGLDVCLRLMAMVIQKLSCKTKDGKAKKKRDGKGKGSPDSTATSLGLEETSHDASETSSTSPAEGKTKDPSKKLEEEWQLQSIRLLEALLAICLHSANSALQRIEPELSYQLHSVEDTLLEVRDQLSRSGVVNSDLAIPLFDSLLRVALAEVSSCPDPPEEKPERKLQVLAEGAAPAGDLSEEVDEVQSCGGKPPGEEEGYDADSESNPEDMAKQEEGLKVEPAALHEFVEVADRPGRGTLLFPEICTMELQLLASGSPDLEVLSHVFHSLLSAVHANHHNAALLYDQGGVKTILSGFHNILSQTNHSFTDCQTVLVELLVAMVSQRITAEELALLSRLFLEKTPPNEILLKGILQIVEANMNIEPLHFLSFPIILGASTPGVFPPSSRQNCAAGGKSVGLPWKSKLSPGRREGEAEYQPSHLRTSPWHIAPLHLPLVGQNCWPHMASGFSTSIWLRVAEQGAKDGDKNREESNPPAAELHHASSQAGTRLLEEGLIHILSMGSKALMLQVWADFSTGALTFRICIDPNDEIKAGLLAQADSAEGLFSGGQWQHLALTYSQQPEGKKNVHGRVVVWVSGIWKCEVSLDYTLPRKSSLSSDSNKTFCMLGHCVPSSEEMGTRWNMGTVLLFNGSRIGSEEAFYLYTSGPDLTSIMPCKYGKPSVTFSKFVTQEGLKCEHVREILMKSKDVDTTTLVESLAVVYAPSSPRVYTIYEPVIRLKGQAKTVVTQRPFSSKEVQSVSLESSALRALLPTETHGLQSVLHKIGGTGTFVFLFAQTVELSDCEKTQALALQVLLSLSKFNQHRIHEMDCYHGYSMIHQVLIKPKCIVGYHMLKTLLDGCCSGPILILGEDGQFHLDAESVAVVQDLRLLSDILLDWKIWAKAECGVWETLLAALEILIRVHHPHQVFNIRQFLKAEVVHRFLLTCQVLQEHRDEHLTAIPQEVSLSFIKIIQEVLGSPPDMDLLKLIYNFLMAVHPPTNTYVCHTPSTFYFSLHIDGKLYQEKVQSIMYLRHSNSGGKSASSSVVSLSPTAFADAPHDGHLHASSLDHGGDDQSLRAPSLGPSPYSSPLLTPRLGRSSSNEAAEGDGASLATHQALGSTETLKKGGGDEQLLSSCESAKTICEDKDAGEGATPRTPSISVEEERDEAAEVDSLADGSVGVAESEDRFEWVMDEAPRRPDSLKGIPSFQRSHSNLASLGLAFPATNGSLTISRWPTAADRSSIPEDWESYTYSPGYERAHSKTESNDRSSTEDCLVLICCGLYDLLRGILLLLPDLMLEEVMDKLIQTEALIVLVNHSSPLIQQGVMKLLDAYFTRALKEQKEKFLKNHGFSLLANQLYIHQGSQGLLECFLEMLFGRPVGLEEDLDLEEMENLSPFRKRCIIPVLGLIENSLYENSLVHNILCMLLQLINACPKLADILLDHGLLYVLFNTLSTLNGMENGIPLNDYKLLVCDIQQMLVAVTIHSCSSSGSQYFRIIEDLITLLGFMQTSKMRRTQEMAVALQFRVLQSAIEFIKTTANQEPQKLSTSVNAPSSPHHAIYQKRKSIAGRRRFSLAQTDSLLMRMRSVASDELNQMMQRRMSQENPIRASETEFVQRLQRLVVLAVNRLIYHDVSQDLFDLLNIPECTDQQLFTPDPADQPHEDGGSASVPHSPTPFTLPPASKKSFQKDILQLMMDGIKVSLGSTGRGGAPHQQWRRILWSCRDTFRVQIGRLLVHTLSPALPLSDRKEALQFVFDPKHLDILKESLSPGLEHGPKLSLYLYEMLHDHKDNLTKEEQSAVGVFMTSLKLCGHRCIPPNAPHKQDLLKAIKEEKFKYEAEEKTSKVAWEKKMANAQRNLIQRLDGKSKDISKIAADITQTVSLRQGMERKKVIQHIRGLYKTDLSASRHWQELVQQLTHDRAVWYDPTSYPTSWQLDPTEGPNRERRRLQRCYLTIPNKYLLKDRRKPEETVKPPLSFLFEDKTHSSFSSTVKDKATSESIRFTRRCISVAPSRETAGELLLGKCGMYFVEDNAADAHDNQSLHGETEAPSFSWTYEEIKEVHKRWWQLRDNAVEIFLTNGRTLLLAFDNSKFRDDVYHNILTSDLPNLLEHGNITALTQLWGSGQISNFEYLTHLNKHAGRSFNDLMQYPVFPFILRDYTNETLDLQDPNIYRNLSKPIAVQSKEKEDRYVDNYRYLEEEYKKGIREDDPMPPVQPYHYGSHYSNSGTVLHFLVRMPPFTKMFLAYQDQSFDIPDRTFHSMNTTWRLSSYESMTDVKELIPEFFYLPEFLVNREGFDFGVRQNGERVNHVNLPPWARNDPRLFILIHRQALESDQVSQTLCQWIDLVFGLKQKGKAAVQAINVFHPATYFGMDVSAVEDPVQRRALETMIKTYGQTPRQLFNTSHISRTSTKLMEGELPAAMGLLVQLAFRESREPAKEIVCPSPLPWIKGLKWGEYVGSPSAPDPVVCFSQPHGERFGSLLALPTRAICGLSSKFCLMMIYSKEQGVRSMHSTDIQWSAILSWGYADNILRLKSKQSEPPINFIQCSQLHQVTSCAWVPDGCQLFTGSKCGVITAYSNRFTSTTPSEMEVESQVHLYGHTGEVTSLFVCKPYSILISVSNDGTCILWDLNRLCYVQSLTGHKSPVMAVSASETTGDIATVCDSEGGGSDLRLWTVNGDLIGHVHCREIICSLAFSNQPEGVSVNVIAGGLENGVVRLWSTWDLKPVREITFPKSSKPIISLTYSCDGHHLYTANSEGTVMAWCRRDQQRMKLPMFYSFLSSYAAG